MIDPLIDLQLPHTPSHVAEFDTIQIIDDISVPNENWNKGDTPEPITEYFGPNNPDPENNFGEGGATQAITNKPILEYELNEIANEN